MPNDFSPSILDEVRFKINEIFSMGGGTRQYRKNPPVALQTLMSEQTAQVAGLTQDNTNCLDKEVYFMTPDDTTLPTVQTTAGGLGLVCDIPDGTFSSSFKKTYSPNIFMKKSISVDDKDCDNQFKFNEKVAQLLADQMSIMADSFNRYVIGQLVANAQTPTAAGNFPTGTINGTTIEYGAASFEDSKLLGELQFAAIKENLADNYFLIDGGNLAILNFNSMYTRLNDNERSTNAQLINGQDIYYDLKALDIASGANSTFVIDPNMYALYANNIHTSDSLVEIGDKDNTKVFRVPLQYFDLQGNPQTLTFRSGGQTIPVYLDVDYRYQCVDPISTSRTYRQYRHTWELKLQAMFDIAPTTGDTGILHVVKV